MFKLVVITAEGVREGNVDGLLAAMSRFQDAMGAEDAALAVHLMQQDGRGRWRMLRTFLNQA